MEKEISEYSSSEFRESVENYLKLSHQTLAELLALRDEKDEKTMRPTLTAPSTEPLQPSQPITTPPWTWNPVTTQLKLCPLTTGGRCTNPYNDCINCPYHGVGVTYDSYATTQTNFEKKMPERKTKLND